MSPLPTIVYLGTPDYAVAPLRALAADDRWNIAAVITQPDKPSGRGQKLQPPPAKVVAEELGIEVFQPSSIKDLGFENAKLIAGKHTGELCESLNSQPSVDAFIAVAYGKLIPKSMMDFASAGVINIHPSLLPRWRGAAPLQYTIFSGDTDTGVSLMQIDEGLDTGPVYTVEPLTLSEEETFGSLHDKTSEIGAKMLVKHLPDILSGHLAASKQSEEGATYAEKWEKGDWKIDWSEDATTCARRIRACFPAPGARALRDDQTLKIYKATCVADKNFDPSEPGVIVSVNKTELIVACGHKSYLSIEEAQLPGKRRLPVEEILRGAAFRVGEKLE